ncbi:cytochrome d ubiquinol oxidase subunit II, partial [Klebsiella michiganensis]
VKACWLMTNGQNPLGFTLSAEKKTQLVAAISAWLWRALRNSASHLLPFVLTLGLIFLGFSGLGISIWPYIIPPGITLWQAAAPPQSQGFMLVGALLILPVILGYTFWSYYVFRGQVQHGEGYH